MKYDYTCFIDGACEPKNPGGNMGIGAIILDADGNTVKTLSHFVKAKPENSNNVAEYQAFGWLVTELNRIMPPGATILIQGDSKLVIEQMNGKWRIKEGHYVQFAHRAKKILNELQAKCKVTIMWIPREENNIADELSETPMIQNNVTFRIQPLQTHNQ